EYAYWEEQAHSGKTPGSQTGVWTMNCEPVVEAGQGLLVGESYSLDDTPFLSSTPGQPPCHCCVPIPAIGQERMPAAGLMVHTLRCREPDWSTGFCSDPAQAAKSRRQFLTHHAGSHSLVLPVHFPHPTAGRIEVDGTRFRYRFVS